MAPIRDRADFLLDTSEMNVHQLKAEIERLKDQLSFMTKECKRFEALSDE